MRTNWRWIGVILSAASGAMAAEPISMKSLSSPGERWKFDGTSIARLDATASFNGQSQPLTINSKQHHVGKAEVVSVADGVVTGLRITFDEASSDDTTVSGHPQQTPFPYAGKTITVTRGADGTISDDFGGASQPQAVTDLHGMLDEEWVYLPTHPVVVGDEWSADPTVLARMLQLSGDDRAGMTLKLLGVKSLDNRDVAVIKLSTIASRRQNQMQMRITMQGTAMIDLKTGHAVKSEMTGTIENRGEQPGPGANGEQVSYHVEGAGTLSSEGGAPLLETGDPAKMPAAVSSATPPPLAAASNSTAMMKLPGYAVAVSTDGGKTLTAHKEARSVTDAFKAVFPELANYFDDRPALVGAFEDTRDHKSGTATFTAHLNNSPVRGIVACQLTDKGSDVAVTYCTADADNAQWSKLLNAGSGTTAGVSAAAAPAMTVYQFPDGTGSISIAEGWTTQAQSDLAPVVVKGPADQTITLGASLSVQSPDSQMLQMQRQNDAWMIHISGKPLPHPKMLIAPFSGPVDAVVALMPQIAAMTPPGQPTAAIDHVEQTQELQPISPGGRAAVVTYNVTQTDAHGSQKHFRANSQVECAPLGQSGAWMVTISEASAPTETFDHDWPIMLAMMRSKVENNQVCQQMISNNAKAMSDAQQAQFEAGQKAHRDQMATFDAQNKAWAHDEYQKDRNNADFIEVIRGERAIVDTSTGSKGYADLSDAGKIADDLNAHDPGRYKELPLRDELYPVAPGAR